MDPHEVNKPFRWPISGRCVISASTDKVWKTIAAPGILEVCHPFCASNPVKTWPGPESRDEVHYYDGRIVHRKVTMWDEGVGFDLDLEVDGRRWGKASWRVRPSDDANSVLTLIMYPWRLQRFPIVIRWLPHLLVKPRAKNYVMCLLKGFEFHINTGKTVRRNQFGTP